MYKRSIFQLSLSCLFQLKNVNFNMGSFVRQVCCREASRGRVRLPTAFNFILPHSSIYSPVKDLLGMQRQVLNTFSFQRYKVDTFYILNMLYPQ